MVIYLDIIFFQHYVIDRVIAGWFRLFFPYAGHRLRWELGIAILAGVQMPEEVIWLLDGSKWKVLLLELFAVSGWIFFVYREKNPKRFIRMQLVYLTGCILLGGTLYTLLQGAAGQKRMQLWQEHPGTFYAVLLLGSGVAELLFSVFLRQRQLSDLQRLVVVYGNGSRVVLSGYIDTGNVLRDPESGKPVVVIPYTRVVPCLTAAQIRTLELYFRAGEPDLLQEGLHTLTCETAGTKASRLPLWTAEKMIVKRNKSEVVHRNQPVMLCKEVLLSGEYDVLLNGQMKEL